MIQKMFVNVPVESARRSAAFFGELGFRFDEHYSSDSVATMVVSDHNVVMFIEREQFEGFIDKPAAPANVAEAILGLECDSAATIDRIVSRALELGARRVNEPEDEGFMYSWGFEDLDGHLWNLFWMNTAA
ncbi:MAG TPA: VOC family protein [Microbacteriaceae bacterium]|nr:VOC family protein [Microbacteriaceae bacterium]